MWHFNAAFVFKLYTDFSFYWNIIFLCDFRLQLPIRILKLQRHGRNGELPISNRLTVVPFWNDVFLLLLLYFIRNINAFLCWAVQILRFIHSNGFLRLLSVWFLFKFDQTEVHSIRNDIWILFIESIISACKHFSSNFCR